MGETGITTPWLSDVLYQSIVPAQPVAAKVIELLNTTCAVGVIIGGKDCVTVAVVFTVA